MTIEDGTMPSSMGTRRPPASLSVRGEGMAPVERTLGGFADVPPVYRGRLRPWPDVTAPMEAVTLSTTLPWCVTTPCGPGLPTGTFARWSERCAYVGWYGRGVCGSAHDCSASRTSHTEDL